MVIISEGLPFCSLLFFLVRGGQVLAAFLVLLGKIGPRERCHETGDLSVRPEKPEEKGTEEVDGRRKPSQQHLLHSKDGNQPGRKEKSLFFLSSFPSFSPSVFFCFCYSLLTLDTPVTTGRRTGRRKAAFSPIDRDEISSDGTCGLAVVRYELRPGR